MTEISEITPRTSDSSQTLAETAFDLAKEVKDNFQDLLQEWKTLQDTLQMESNERHSSRDVSNLQDKNKVCVSLNQLERLKSETKILKDNLPKVLNSEYITAYSRLSTDEIEIKTLRTEVQNGSAEIQHWKSRYQNTLLQFDKEKEEKFTIQCELSELMKQLSEQSEYCASLGAAVCTLLWRVSRSEDSIKSFLVGSKVDDFFVMVHHTLESYIATYQDEMPEEQTDEAQFVLALCGIITNIAASAYGREFLMTNTTGQTVLVTMVTVLSQTPVTHSAKLRNLILMCLYNISINQKGLDFIINIEGIIPLLAWLLTEEKETDNQIHTLKLMQSLTIASDNIKLIHQINEELPIKVLERFCSCKHQDLRETALELMMDMKAVQAEP
ncbi:heat shock factor 2-binding protein-like [Glandiceps talaboti]